MDQETLNLSIRKFLKTVGVSSQREIEQAVAKAIEAGTIGATPAVQNAVIDAVAHLGVRHIDIPCTPERVWRAIVDAHAGTLSDPWREPPAALAGLKVRQPRAPRPEQQVDI